MDASELIESVSNIYISKPEDYSGRELYYTIQEMNHAIIALKELVLFQNDIIMDLRKKLVDSN